MISPIDILVFLAVLGVLVFVHEMGHFLAAKACGVYVDRFSLGMPPRIFGFKVGETDYCIGLLPIGGYVKMAGQEDAPLSEEERESTYGHVPPDRWFNNKAIWQRAIVLVAGPAMNLVLAFVIYAFMAGYGHKVTLAEIDNRVGYVKEDSPGREAKMYRWSGAAKPDTAGEPDSLGWLPGDRVIAIEGEEIDGFQDLVVAAILSSGDPTEVEIERLNESDEPERYLSVIQARVLDEKLKATQFGVSPFHTALIAHVLPGSPAEENGLEKDDVVLRVDGRVIDQTSFSEYIRAREPGESVDLLVDREGETLPLQLATRNEGTFKDIAFAPFLRPMVRLYDDAPAAIAVENTAFRDRTGLRHGDRIVSVGGADGVMRQIRELEAGGFDQVVSLEVQSRGAFFGLLPSKPARTVEVSLADLVYGLTDSNREAQPVVVGITEDAEKALGLKRKDRLIEIDGGPASVARLLEMQQTRIGETIAITVERPSVMWGLIAKAETLEAELKVEPIQQIGVAWGQKTVFHREEAAQVIPAAFRESVKQVKQIGNILAGLISRDISPELLGGPVMIGEVVISVWKTGLFRLFELTAMISINLAIFNLLPLPVLDGGQLTLLGIEAIRRRPVSLRVTEMVQQAGFVLILGLLFYVTFNDISRIVDNWLP